MTDEINNKLNELLLLLDSNIDIININNLKKQIDPALIELINKYRITANTSLKKEIYNNPIFKEYNQSQNNINYLVLAINNKFKMVERSCHHESN